LLGQRNELVGEQQATLRMLPAHQSLGADQHPTIHLGLIVEPEIVPLHRLAQIFFHRGAGVYRSLQGRSEEVQRVAACCLRLIHGNVRLLQNFVGAVLGISKYRDPNAGTAAAFTPIQQVRFVQSSENFLGDCLGLGCCLLGKFAEILEQHHKLISAQARDRVGFSDVSENPPRNFLQQQVTDVMAERVVQGLEIVEIDEQQCPLVLAARARSQTLPQPVQQQAAVGQTGERVKECEIPDLVMGRLQLLQLTLSPLAAQHAQSDDTSRSQQRSEHADKPKPPRRIPRSQDSEGELRLLPAPYAIAILCFNLQAICTWRQLGKLQFSLRGLGPGRIRTFQAVAKQNAVFAGNIQRGISCAERVGMRVERMCDE